MEGTGSTSSPSPAPAPWESQSPADAQAASSSDSFAERPEVYVGAAFAGGLVVAGLLRWIGSR
jgi:hypothetical protein